MSNYRYERDYSSTMRRRRKKKQQRQTLAVLFAVVLIVGITLMVNSIRSNREYEALQAEITAYENTFQPGVTINGVELTGYTYEQACTVLNERYAANINKTTLLTFGDTAWEFTPTLVGAHIDLETQVQRAWAYGKTGTDLERRAEIRALAENPIDLSAELTFNMTALEEFVTLVKSEVDCEPIHATRMVVDIEKFVFTDSAVGYRLNAEQLIHQLSEIILEGGAEQIELMPEVLAPSPSREELEASTVLLGECTTSLETSSSSRDYNVNLALGMFNFMTVEPGETVSFNKVVGKRTSKNGFKQAPEYAGTTVVTGIGGGVCQASTTLYGALIRAGLQIVERHPHTMTVAYVESSLDAAVNNDDKNLRFKNNTEDQLFFFAWTDAKKETATVKIYGKPIDTGVRIEIVSDVTQMDIRGTEITYVDDTEGKSVWYTDETAFLEAGKPGRRSTAYRVYYDVATGAELKREKLSSDYYAPQNDVYLRGVHPR